MLLTQIKGKIGNDYSKDLIIESVIKAEYYPAKSLTDNDFNNQFAKQLSIVIDAYFGATNGTSIITIQECAEIFKEKYSYLGIEEVKMAARYSVDNQLQNKTYFGQFTCALFVEMMNKYVSHRLTIRNALKTALNEKLIFEENNRIAMEKEKQFEIIANDWLNQRLSLNDIQKYSDIPFAMANYWHKKFEERKDLKKLAIEYAKNELGEERNVKFYSGDRIRADHIYRILNGNNNNELINHAKPIYMRLLVMDYIKKNITLPDDPEKNGKESQEF